MSESGMRRIKRSVLIDIQSVRFADEQLRARVKDLPHLEKELEREQVTNVGLYQAYAEGLLKAHPEISTEATCLVRRLQPTDAGMPLEVYAFTTRQAFAEYEEVQGEIFDHLVAMAPRFEVRMFQRPSGAASASD
jgi:miniconductance mechanosensitive channel